MSIFLNENSKVIVQGMTGSEGMKHTRRMLAAGTNVGVAEREWRLASRGTLENTDILLRGGKIAVIGSNLAAPAGGVTRFKSPPPGGAAGDPANSGRAESVAPKRRRSGRARAAG